MAKQKAANVNLCRYGVKRETPPEDCFFLLLAVGDGIITDQGGQLPTEEERDLAARLLIDWSRRHKELWERSPEAAARINREIGKRIEREEAERKSKTP